MSDCCHTHDPAETKKQKRDWILLGSFIVLALTIGAYFIAELLGYSAPHSLHHFAHAALQILGTMWWGVALGIVMVGLMSKLPRELFTSIMGKSGNISGLFRAVLGGLFLDLCCHGILLIAAKLYERGVSLAQVVTFLVASPWNSVSLTLVLIGLIGLQWTLLYILGSVVIALITGVILQQLVKHGVFPDNPNTPDDGQDAKVGETFKAVFASAHFSFSGTGEILKSGWRDGKMIVKWLLFGTIIAAAMRTFIPADVFAQWLGPNVLGLLITLLMATIVEICSEGSAPIASEIVSSANAPGNGFTFLMAGVATDYTEIMAVREFTGKWMIAFALPLITVPQVLFIGFLMNMAATTGG